MPSAAMDLPIRMMSTTASTCSGCRTSTEGSKSIPTETKKRTANASWKGSASADAWWLRSDSLITTPAKNAPSANDTPNSAAAPNATPMATASTLSVNNSREPVRATRASIHGTARRPTMNISARNAITLPSVMATAAPTLPPPSAGVPPMEPARAGSSTSASTIARSSTISHPTAMRPSAESTSPRCSSARSSTTVLATESDRPNTTPCPHVHPHVRASTAPMSVAAEICTTAPGREILRTASRSPREKCSPTPNISRITPISASCDASAASPTKPGVNGPTATPASR